MVAKMAAKESNEEGAARPLFPSELTISRLPWRLMMFLRRWLGRLLQRGVPLGRADSLLRHTTLLRSQVKKPTPIHHRSDEGTVKRNMW